MQTASKRVSIQSIVITFFFQYFFGSWFVASQMIFLRLSVSESFFDFSFRFVFFLFCCQIYCFIKVRVHINFQFYCLNRHCKWSCAFIIERVICLNMVRFGFWLSTSRKYSNNICIFNPNAPKKIGEMNSEHSKVQ